jgi:hypothetical protein
MHAAFDLLLRLFGALAAMVGLSVLSFHDTGTVAEAIAGLVSLVGGGWLALRRSTRSNP